ncbi:MAG: hypothetical protein IJG15_07765 [Lachnospiraceae bacterium]|nr:hypothetical protein [Lachnospiraceae bacterium]
MDRLWIPVLRGGMDVNNTAMDMYSGFSLREGGRCYGQDMDRSLVRETEYYKLLQHELEALGGGNVDISIRDVRKNNGIYRKACTVRFAGAPIAPTIYLEPFYDHYLKGEAVSESAQNILDYCREKTPSVTLPENFFREFDTIGDRLGIKLIGTTRNQALLQDVPHVDFEGLSAVFYYLLKENSLGNGMIMVRNVDLERWHMTVQELYQSALRTCPQMLPPVFRPLSEVLSVLEPTGEGELYLLTNEGALYGASVILYPGILQEAASYIDGDYFVLPSSVHEVILLPDHGEDPRELLQIVREINHTQVSEEEVLIDGVFHYHAGDPSIVRVA